MCWLSPGEAVLGGRTVLRNRLETYAMSLRPLLVPGCRRHRPMNWDDDASSDSRALGGDPHAWSNSARRGKDAHAVRTPPARALMPRFAPPTERFPLVEFATAAISIRGEPESRTSRRSRTR